LYRHSNASLFLPANSQQKKGKKFCNLYANLTLLSQNPTWFQYCGKFQRDGKLSNIATTNLTFQLPQGRCISRGALGYIVVEEGSRKNIRGRDPVQLKLELQDYIIILQQQHVQILDKKVRSKGMMNIYLYIGFHLIAVYFNFICPILPYKIVQTRMHPKA
jgi:hypothetical protein